METGKLCKILLLSYIAPTELGSWGSYTPTLMSHWLRDTEEQGIVIFQVIPASSSGGLGEMSSGKEMQILAFES